MRVWMQRKLLVPPMQKAPVAQLPRRALEGRECWTYGGSHVRAVAAAGPGAQVQAEVPLVLDTAWRSRQVSSSEEDQDGTK